VSKNFSRFGLVGLIFTVSLSMTACGPGEKPPVIDTTTEVKMPVVQPVNQLELTPPKK
jgi:hypothetical protein